MTPKVKISKMFFRILRWDTNICFATNFGGNRPLWSCRKVVWFTAQKNSCFAGLVLASTLPPFCPKWADCAQKITWTLPPLDMSTYTAFCPDRLRFARLIPERLIFRPKTSLQYRLSAYNYKLNILNPCLSEHLLKWYTTVYSVPIAWTTHSQRQIYWCTHLIYSVHTVQCPMDQDHTQCTVSQRHRQHTVRDKC